MKIKFEKHFDEAEKLIDNAGQEGLKEAARYLKGKLRSKINSTFNKRTGSLLKGVQDQKDINNKENKEIAVGITKNVRHALWLNRGTGIRRHKSGKSVGKLRRTDYINDLLKDNRSSLENIIIKYFKRI